MRQVFFLILITLVSQSCHKKPEPEAKFSSREISGVIAEMTDAMVNDITNPPLAGRFFAYACLAGYEVASQNDSSLKSMHGILNEYPRIEKPAGISGYSWQLSSLLAMMETAQKMQPSGTLIQEYETAFLDSCRRNGIPEKVIGPSLQYAKTISKDILAYALTDRYNRISNYPRYSPSGAEGSWYPTPPGYFAPVEPHFNTIRAFTLDSASQFKPRPPVEFSTDKNSEFYRLLKEVYVKGGAELSVNQQEVAAFWDCNPFALQDQGHLMTGLKKISPGAHWLGITGIACQNAGFDFSKSMKANTMVAVTLMDGFVACWDEKFRSNRIRPETAIRKYLDPQWKPLLQTPPFPEYLSGHSTISSASAEVLSYYFGENFAYNDTIEVRYGLPARKFSSFKQAAEEAGISRLYGGIHFMDAIDNGQLQGQQVGLFVLKKLEGKEIKPSDILAEVQ